MRQHVVSAKIILCVALLWSGSLSGAKLRTAARHPQSSPTPTVVSPLPLGTVTQLESTDCRSVFASGMRCKTAIINCNGAAPLRAMYGVLTPSSPKGTIVLLSGGAGRGVYNQGFPERFFGSGYQVVQLSWSDDWKYTGDDETKNIRTAACRPATLVRHIYDVVHGGASNPGGMGALGKSAGSAALVYALTWYNAGSFLDKVSLLAGPVYSDIKQVCMVPLAPPVTVCPSGQMGCVGQNWVSKVQSILAPETNRWSGETTCLDPRGTPASANTNWLNMSSESGLPGASYSYPKTALSGRLCSNGSGVSGRAQNYYSKFTKITQLANDGVVPFYSVNRIDNCRSDTSEDVETGITTSGQLGADAIVEDMIHPVVGVVKRH